MSAVIVPVRPGTATHPAPEPGSRGFVLEYAAWIDDELILVLGSVRIEATVRASPAAGLVLAPRAGTGETPRLLDIRRARQDPGGPMPSLTVEVHGVPTVVPGSEVERHLVDLKTLVREGLAARPGADRNAVIDFLVRSAPVAAAPPRGAGASWDHPGARLSASLHAVREALRERLPVGHSAGGPLALVDSLGAIDENAFYLRGRVGTGTSRLRRVTVVSPEGARVEILASAHWYDLRDAAPDALATARWRGFAALVVCPRSLRPAGWIIELETVAGQVLEVPAPSVTRQPFDITRQVLEDLGHEPLPDSALRRKQVRPALRRLQRRRRREVAVEQITQLGTPPVNPTVSVVVPLYRRTDLVEHQLAHFVDDPEMRACDLVYVLDSPDMAQGFHDEVERLARLYPIPFRVAVLSHNVGYATANNIGVSVAHGRVLLLLNSDVFPDQPGWLGRMVRFHDATPKIGALGPKLVYEDDTLQHAGMYFEKPSGTHLWNNEHFFKGLHKDIPAAAESRPVASVTGACMMVDAKLYRAAGGLSGEYVQGDFEDSDLCLRLAALGRQNWYQADVALYHLEASSYDPTRRSVNDGYNRWLHTHLWHRQIRAACAAYPKYVPVSPPSSVASLRPALAPVFPLDAGIGC